MISKTMIRERIGKKTNPALKEVLIASLKNPAWNALARILSSSTNDMTSKNLSEIEHESSLGDTIVVPGKILSGGNLTKKVRVCALTISEKAREKLKESKSEFVALVDEIKKNHKAEGVKILR